jgi:hypothetical protein
MEYKEYHNVAVPMPKFLGVASNNGFLVFLVCLVAKGAGAGVLEDFAFGGYIP